MTSDESEAYIIRNHVNDMYRNVTLSIANPNVGLEALGRLMITHMSMADHHPEYRKLLNGVYQAACHKMISAATPPFEIAMTLHHLIDFQTASEEEEEDTPEAAEHQTEKLCQRTRFRHPPQRKRSPQTQ